jgi:hypothetical protein
VLAGEALVATTFIGAAVATACATIGIAAAEATTSAMKTLDRFLIKGLPL